MFHKIPSGDFLFYIICKFTGPYVIACFSVKIAGVYHYKPRRRLKQPVYILFKDAVLNQMVNYVKGQREFGFVFAGVLVQQEERFRFIVLKSVFAQSYRRFADVESRILRILRQRQLIPVAAAEFYDILISCFKTKLLITSALK